MSPRPGSAEKREAWFHCLLAEKRRLAQDYDYKFEEPDKLWTARRSMTRGRPGKWTPIDKFQPHDLREVLPNEVIFDIGDHMGYEQAMRQSLLLWDIIEEFEFAPWNDPDGDFLGGLTGGKGVHTHIFLDLPPLPRDELMETRRLYGVALLGLLRKRLGYEPDVDKGHLHPSEESKIVRTFGAWKSKPKTLVARRGQRWVSKVTNRTRGYSLAGMRLPEHFERIQHPIAVRHHAVRDGLGQPCPRNTECFTDDGTFGGFCAQCPVRR